jgi:hypothetical protein
MLVFIGRANGLIEGCCDIGHGSSSRVAPIPSRLELVHGNLEVGLAVVLGRRELARAHVHLHRWQDKLRHTEVGVTAVRMSADRVAVRPEAAS